MFASLQVAVWLALVAVSLASSVARNPLSRLATIESPRILTNSRRVHALSSFDLSFSLYNHARTIRLSLEPSHDIFPEGATVSYLHSDGSLRHQEIIDRAEHKVYKGTAKLQEVDGSWTSVGWARLSVLRDGIRPLFEGAFSINHDSHHVQLSSSYMSSRVANDPELALEADDYMVLWRDSDVATDGPDHLYKRSMPGRTCGSDDLYFNSDPSHPVLQDILKRSEKSYLGSMPLDHLLGRRQIDSLPGNGNGNGAGVNLVSTIGQTAGCPNTKRVALVGVATDCTYTGTFNSTASAKANIITQMNSASSLWESAFNITLGLQNLTMSDANCPGSPPTSTPWNQPCEGGPDITQRLNLFSGWRGSLADTNSHWTLLTNCNTGSAVGLAWLGQACVHGSQAGNNSGQAETVSGANVVAKTPQEWQVIAHETGHTYGAVHDCTSQACQDQNFVRSQQCCQLSAQSCDAGAQYIMNPSTVEGINHFSPCSIGNICSAIGRNAVNTTCLSANKGVVTINGQQCGNGIVEAGEDCDCGGEEACGNNPCCDPRTCKFKSNAVCDDSNEDCCQNCQFAPSSHVCRPGSGDCDPQETCTGNSATCPSDNKAPDGQTCHLSANSSVSGGDTGALACASGQCTSRDLQCRTVMSAYIQGNNDTYACDHSSCTMSCASPSFGPGVCYGLQQNLLDGTPCGGGGKCNNGRCDGSSTAKEIQSWIDDHKALVIGIACAVGGLLLLSILCCIYSSCRRRVSRKKTVAAMTPSPATGFYGPPSGQLPSSSQGLMHQRDHTGWMPPPPPPAHHQGLSGNGIIGSRPHDYWQHQQTSMRYA